jgi:CheY-like chemotaxis protein
MLIVPGRELNVVPRAHESRTATEGRPCAEKSSVNKPLESLILIIDDQADDQAVLTYALRRLGIENSIFCLEDGHEAIRYLNGDGPYAERAKFPLPAAIFLDLHLPILSGFEVLDWMHGCNLKREAHMFIYSSLSSVDQIQRVYRLGADSFLKKPVQEVDLLNMIHHFPKPWIMKARKSLQTTI